MHYRRSLYPGIAVACLLTLVFVASPGGAQVEVLHSKVLGEDRIIEIRLPAGYEDPDERFPVLYVLDAEYAPGLGAAIESVATGARAGSSPEMIVIGIRNKNRNRDMIPVAVTHKPGSGGSAEFLQFISEELVPFVDEKYRTDSINVIYGGSNAGLFAVYAILERPDIFAAAIAASPMIGHCPDFMYGIADNLDKPEAVNGRRLFMIYGDDDFEGCTEYVGDFAAYLRDKNAPGFYSDLVLVKNGGHVPASSVARGIEFVFSSTR